MLVTGHYDSRNSDNFNTHDPAPGANDDASGVAVSLESARVLSQLKFPATIVFLAVAGEEQGLNGSRHLAKLARAEGWSLEAVLNNDIVGGDTTPGQTGQDKTAVRVFSEGVPGPATAPELRQIQTYGYESDSASREVARAIAEVDRTYFGGHGRPGVFHPVLEFRRDRFGPRRGPYFVQRGGVCGGAVYGVAGELRSPAPDAARSRRACCRTAPGVRWSMATS